MREITPVEITPGVASAWTDVDVTSYVGADAGDVAGVALIVRNVTTGSTEYSYGLRKNGSTDTRIAVIEDQGWTCQFVGTDASDIFEAYVTSTTLVEIWMIGYFRNEDAGFLTNAPDKSLGVINTWTDIDISADTGGDTALFAFLQVNQTTSSGTGTADWGLRMNGSTDPQQSTTTSGGWVDLRGAVVGCDGSEIFEGITGTTGTDFYLQGYLKDTATAVALTNRVDHSTGTTGEYQDTDLSATVPGGYNSIFYQFDPVGDAEYGAGIRKNGETYDFYSDITVAQSGWIPIDDNRIVEQQIESLNLDFFVIGYATTNFIIDVNDEVATTDVIDGIANAQLGGIDVSDNILSADIVGIGQNLPIVINDTITLTEDIDGAVFFPPFEVNVSSNVTIAENVNPFQIDAGIFVFVNGLEEDDLITQHIVPTSLNVSNILTRQVDRATFTVKKYGSTHTYTPIAGSEVFMYVDGVREFAGYIVRVTQRSEDYKVIYYDVECEDYTRLLDRKLIADTYQNETLGTIIRTLRDRYFRDITVLQVDEENTEIAYAGFNYEQASSALTKLADKLNFDWYIDYYKNLYFISKTSNTAPFVLQDSTDTYIFDTFRLRQDNTQVRNRVFVAGGEYLADTFTTEYQSDGIQNVYPLAYKYDDISVSVTGAVWEQGIDGNDPISTKDYLWNPTEKFIRFRGDRIPNDTSDIRISGQPYLPVRIIVQDDASIQEFKALEGGDGIYEHIIVDDTINSQEGARERAEADLVAYKQSLTEGSFTTKRQGLRAGQRVTINSSVFGVNADYLINSVRLRMKNNIEPRYEVQIVSMKTIGIIEVLQSLILGAKKFTLGEQDIVDAIRGYTDTIVLSETFNSQIDYDVEFVVGPYDTPTGNKRVFVLNRSPLGNDINPYISQEVSISEDVSITVS